MGGRSDFLNAMNTKGLDCWWGHNGHRRTEAAVHDVVLTASLRHLIYCNISPFVWIVTSSSIKRKLCVKYNIYDNAILWPCKRRGLFSLEEGRKEERARELLFLSLSLDTYCIRTVWLTK